jgi:serine protease Do
MQRVWVVLSVVAALGLSTGVASQASETRRTAIVRAIETTRDSVVNIHGQKLVAGTDEESATELRRVNGMGTGVIIDARGYIATNYHVVEGVRRIEVTLASGRTTTATLVSHDPRTDLAVIKIATDSALPVIPMGTSADLMIGETVLALGNAYGYEHTVTRGIISALHRSVEVNRTQRYDDLIQTDASINPGNSGGPLLNIDGEMIGINVAVRAGAQGIGFAIPIDRALVVITELLSTERVERTWHGIVTRGGAADGVLVETVQPDSPAAGSGLVSGDVIKRIGDLPVATPLDVERAMLGRRPGDSVPLAVARAGSETRLDLLLAPARTRMLSKEDRCWQELGLKVEPQPAGRVQKLQARYRGGLLVTDVRDGGPAADQGIRTGDILVGLHVWETITVDNVMYVLEKSREDNLGQLKFYVLRGRETLFGHLTSDTILR